MKVGLLSLDLNNRQVREVLRADGGSVSHTYVGRIRGCICGVDQGQCVAECAIPFLDSLIVWLRGQLQLLVLCRYCH